ncbi:MAG: hypothetical protein HQ465_17235 [Rhodospirillales bacterium]|nr:hypothetical protein [Rhodospirillales bacterium]
MGNLQCRSDLGIRSREQTGNLLGHRLVRRESGQLSLPQIEVSPGQPVEIGARIGCRTGCRVVVSGDHRPTITHRRADAAFASAKVALSHCGIGAKVDGRSK